MAENVVMKAESRDKVGGIMSNRLRDKGMIPAVIYGRDLDKNLHVALNVKEFMGHVHHGSRTMTLDVEGTERTVFIKEVQHGTFDHIILHADFQTYDPNEELTLNVEVELTGEAVGSKEGGVINQEMWNMEVQCKAAVIPDKITLDISGLNINESLLVKDVPTIEGVTFTADPEDTVVVCSPPEEVEETVAEGEEGEEASTEPEVIGEQDEEEGEESDDSGKASE